MLSTCVRCSTPCARLGSANAQGEYYLPDLVRIFRSEGLPVETVSLRRPAGDSGRQQPEGAGRGVGHPEGSQERRADGGRGHDRRSGDDLDCSRRRRRAGHGPASRTCTSRADDAIGSGCEIHSGVRIIDSTDRRRRVINNFCVIRQSIVERGAIVGPFAQLRPGVTRRRGRARRQLRRAQEHDARQGVEGESPRVSRRRDDRREGEHRRRHHHLQLRRRRQAPDGHRGWRLHRHRQPARSRPCASARTPTSPPVRRSPRTCRRGSLAIARGRQVNKPGWIASAKQQDTTTDD